jgi:hypothetical protein
MTTEFIQKERNSNRQKNVVKNEANTFWWIKEKKNFYYFFFYIGNDALVYS